MLASSKEIQTYTICFCDILVIIHETKVLTTQKTTVYMNVSLNMNWSNINNTKNDAKEELTICLHGWSQCIIDIDVK